MYFYCSSGHYLSCHYYTTTTTLLYDSFEAMFRTFTSVAYRPNPICSLGTLQSIYPTSYNSCDFFR